MTKRRILRAVLEEIIVTVDPGRLQLKLHWKGGDHTTLEVVKNRAGQHRWKTDTPRAHGHGQGAGGATQAARHVRRLKFASLRQSAVVEDVDMKTSRGLDKALFAKLVADDWITRHQNLAIIGKTGLVT